MGASMAAATRAGPAEERERARAPLLLGVKARVLVERQAAPWMVDAHEERRLRRTVELVMLAPETELFGGLTADAAKELGGGVWMERGEGRGRADRLG